MIINNGNGNGNGNGNNRINTNTKHYASQEKTNNNLIIFICRQKDVFKIIFERTNLFNDINVFMLFNKSVPNDCSRIFQ